MLQSELVADCSWQDNLQNVVVIAATLVLLIVQRLKQLTSVLQRALGCSAMYVAELVLYRAV